MFPVKRVAGFFVLFLVFYGVLMAPWPGLGGAYAACFRATANLLFGSFAGQGSVRFAPAAGRGREADAEVTFTSPRTGAVGRVPVASRRMGYVPTAMLIGLVLATPLPWSRKVRALLWGFLLINGFVVLRVALVLLHTFSRESICLRAVL